MLFRFLQSNPVVRLVLPLIFGISVGDFFNISTFVTFLILSVLFLILLLFSLAKVQFRYLYGIFVALFFSCLGVFLVQKTRENNALPKDLGVQYVKAIVRGEPEVKEKTATVLLEVVQIAKGGAVSQTHFRSLTYFPNDSTVDRWKYGDTIIVKLRFFPLPKPMNPNGFDYGKLLENRQVYTVARGNSKSVRHLSATKFSIFRMSHSVQKRLAKILETYIADSKSRGFLQAITLGDKTSLSPEVRIDFTNAGVVHILAVSGLHLGILFLLINVVFRQLKKTKLGRRILVVIGLLVIWSFAFISGLSVSILRAAIMFSVMQLGVLSLRPYRIYNSIAVSGLLLLLLNPFYLYEVGFQLSYAAVLGIVIFVPMWNKKVLKNRYLENLKQLFFVSLAAQLGVAPLVLYYFHQLPTYFLLGNFIILSVAPFLLGGTFLILLFSPIQIVAEPIAFLVSRLTKFCIFMINGVAELPHSILLNYSLDFWQMLLLYAILISVVFYILKRNSSYFILILIGFLCFSTYSVGRYFQESQQQIFVVHYVNGKSCYNLISGGSSVLFATKELEEKEIKYAVNPLLVARNVKKIEYCKLLDSEEIIRENSLYKNGHFFIEGRHIVVCNKKARRLEKQMPIDVLILSKEANWEVALKNYKTRIIVLDSSFSKSKSQKLAKEFLALNYIVHNVNIDGAFVLN